MNESLAVDLVRDLVEVPSPSGDEAAVARLLIERMEALGFAARIDEAGNAVGELRGGSGPLVLLLGHLDTVPGEIPVRVDGDVLHGRGAVDAKGPLAAMVCAAVAAAPGLDARLVVAGAVAEETDSRGALALRERLAPDAVVIGEPSGTDGVTLGYKGVVRVVYRVERPPAHAASEGEKAVELAADFWTCLRDLLADVDPEAPMFDRAVPTLTRLHGDLERAEASVSCRTPVGFDVDALGEVLESLARGGAIEVVERTPAVRRGRDDPVVRALAASIRRHGGRPRLKVKSGTSDMNVVAERWRVPMAAYGPGDSSLDHTPEERLDLRDHLRAIEILAGALPEIAEAVRPAEGLSAEDEEIVSRRLEALGYLG